MNRKLKLSLKKNWSQITEEKTVNKKSIRPKIVKKKCPHCRGHFSFIQKHLISCQKNTKKCQQCHQLIPNSQLVIKFNQQKHECQYQSKKTEEFRIKKVKALKKRSIHPIEQKQTLKQQIQEFKTQSLQIQPQKQPQIIKDNNKQQIVQSTENILPLEVQPESINQEPVQNQQPVQAFQLNQTQINYTDEVHRNEVEHLLSIALQQSPIPSIRLLIDQLRTLNNINEQVKKSLADRAKIKHKLAVKENAKRKTEDDADYVGEQYWDHINSPSLIIIFKNNKQQGMSEEEINRRFPKKVNRIKEVECNICMQQMDIQEQYRKLQCNHCYHVSCIDKWLSLKANCPSCRLRLIQD